MGVTSDPKAELRPTARYRQVAQLTGHKRAIAATKFSPSGELLASASADASVMLWSAKTRWSCERQLDEHAQGINDVAWGHDATFLATASDDKTVKLWESDGPTDRAQALSTFSGHASYVFCCAFSPRGNHLLATGSYDETVKLWDVRTGRCCKTLPAHSDPVTAVDFSLDGTVVISASHDGLLRLWDVASGQCLKTIFAQPQSSAPVSFARYAPNSKFVLASTLDHTIRLWTATNPSRCVKTYRGHANDKYCAAAAFVVAGRACGQRLIGGSEDCRVCVWDLQTRELLQRLEGHTDVVLAVDCHPTHDIVASGAMASDRTVRLWAEDGVDPYAGLAGEPEPAPAEKSSAEPAAEAAASAPPPPSGESERDVAAAAVDEAEVRPSAPEAADDAETRDAESHVDANPDATGDEPASKRARGPEGGDLP